MIDIWAPSMDWSMADRTAAYKLFKQKTLMYFDCKDIATEKQVSYILLMTGDEGVHMFNSWGLEKDGDDAKNPDKVWEKFDAHVELRSSFHVERLTFQCNVPEVGRKSDDFITHLTN